MRADPAFSLTVAQNDDCLYLECPKCEDIVTGLEPGGTLPDLLAAARQHYELYHADDDS